MRQFYSLLFSFILFGALTKQKIPNNNVNISAETYLFNDKRLGINAIERLLADIETLSKAKKSAAREINEWRNKNSILDSLSTRAEAEIALLQEELEQGRSEKAKFEKRINELEQQLAIAHQSFQRLQDSFNRAIVENARIQDSLRQEISFRELWLFKMAEEDFRNGARVFLMKTNRKGQLIYINHSTPKKAAKIDVDAIVLYYDFSASKILQLPRTSKIEVSIPALKYYNSFSIRSVAKEDFNQYKGRVVIPTGNNALNLYKTGTIYLNVKIFEGEKKIESKPNSLHVILTK